MRRQYHIQNLDCAHCAMKMENAARQIEGVEFVSVNFLSLKLTLEADDKRFDSVFRQVEKRCREVEPEVVFTRERYQMSGSEKGTLIQILCAVLLFIGAKVTEEMGLLESKPLLSFLTFLPSYFISGFAVLRKAISGIFHMQIFDENFLMTLATVGAFAIGEAGEGVMVMLLYCIGEFFQDLAVSKSRRNVSELMDIRPESATILEGAEEKKVLPEQVPVGSIILVKPGEKIPLDGTVTDGDSFLDTGALTGESAPREVSVGDSVSSGCINMNRPLKIRTEKAYHESAVAKILSLIEDAEEGKSKAERFITRFARYYTPVVVLLALGLAFIPPLLGAPLEVWIKKAVVCLVISCPCALVISVPLSFFGGIGCAGRRGILIKGADVLEKLTRVKAFAFDKTGTLTRGEFKVTAIHPEKMQEAALLELATACEHYSNHPISQSLKNAFRGEIDPTRIGRIEEIAGRGVVAEIEGKSFYVGNEALMEDAGLEVHPCAKCHHIGTVVHIGSSEEYLGHIVISDTLRPDAKKAISDLRSEGITSIRLLSGDDSKTADDVGKELGVDSVLSNLLPEDKLNAVDEMKSEFGEGIVAFVGDGLNDTPPLARSDLGIAMGGIGADAAVEAADIVLIDDKPSKIALAVQIAKKTLGIVWQNVFLSIGIKLTVLIPNIFWGEESIPTFLAVFADVGICLIAILNATRALRIREKK